MKYLGVQLDDHITFENHINYIHAKATEKHGIFRKSRPYLDRKTSLLLYKDLVLLHLDYCNLVYMCTNVQNLNKLQLVQNIACRTILLCPQDTSVRYMHSELEIMTLEQRRSLHLRVECYKNITNPDLGLSNMFIPLQQIRVRTTRQTDNRGLGIPNIRSKMGRQFSYGGSKDWMEIDPTTRNIDKLAGFKNELIKQM